MKATMTIPEHKFVSIPDFLTIVAKYPNLGWIYRGQVDASLPLLPKAGRPKFFKPETSKRVTKGYPPRDIGRFNEWRNNAVAFCSHLPDNDFECLAFAQHYGLATRLLDWTTNPLVALYFAAEGDFELEGGVFCYLPWLYINHKKADLQAIDQVARYDPRPFDRRILSQAGVFTFHPDPNVPLEPQPPHPDVAKIAPDGVNLVLLKVIPEMKPILLRWLNEIGVNRKSLFPDLEGLSRHINWETRDNGSEGLT